ncbi:MAG: ArsR/SmtB family transcription factor [Candidatus Hodarchaeota archaeon]
MLASDYQNAIAAFFRALGNETRISILQILQIDKELNVMEISNRLKMQQYHISRHLACLRNCGLVTARREGRVVFYSLNGHNRISQILSIADTHVQTAFESILACKVLNNNQTNIKS